MRNVIKLGNWKMILTLLIFNLVQVVLWAQEETGGSSTTSTKKGGRFCRVHALVCFALGMGDRCSRLHSFTRGTAGGRPVIQYLFRQGNGNQNGGAGHRRLIRRL